MFRFKFIDACNRQVNICFKQIGNTYQVGIFYLSLPVKDIMAYPCDSFINWDMPLHKSSNFPSNKVKEYCNKIFSLKEFW